MPRRQYLLLGMAVLVTFAVIVWSFADKPAISPAVVGAATSHTPQPAPEAAPATNDTPVHSTALKKTTAQWIADTASGDAATRAAAIEALAEAPRTEALPVLGRLLTDGEPQIDRVLALRALRDLALNQGDADGAIRDAIRHAIYHGDDLTKVDDVQEALEIIEESLQSQ